MHRLALGCVAILLLSACDGGGGDSETTLGGTSAASSTTDDPSTSGEGTSMGEVTTGEGSSSGGGEAGNSSSGGEAGSSSGGGESTGNPNACDPPVVGEYNGCTDDDGGGDTTLCNYVGSGQSVGQVTCLNGPTEGANTCTIVNCVDDCDCFNVPATGDAPSVCRAAVTTGGDNACVLACDEGQTCPDEMTCDNGICWHGL